MRHQGRRIDEVRFRVVVLQEVVVVGEFVGKRWRVDDGCGRRCLRYYPLIDENPNFEMMIVIAA